MKYPKNLTKMIIKYMKILLSYTFPTFLCQRQMLYSFYVFFFFFLTLVLLLLEIFESLILHDKRKTNILCICYIFIYSDKKEKKERQEKGAPMKQNRFFYLSVKVLHDTTMGQNEAWTGHAHFKKEILQ